MDNFALIRKEKGLLQKDVAAAMHVTQQTYCNYEKGTTQPSMDFLCRLADFFGVSVDYLIGHNTRTYEEPKEYQKIFESLSERNQTLAMVYMQGLLASEGKGLAVVIPMSKNAIN